MVLFAGSGIALLPHAAPPAGGDNTNILPETSSSAFTHNRPFDAATSSIAWRSLGTITTSGETDRPAAMSAIGQATSAPAGMLPSGSLRVAISRPATTALTLAVSGTGVGTAVP